MRNTFCIAFALLLLCDVGVAQEKQRPALQKEKKNESPGKKAKNGSLIVVADMDCYLSMDNAEKSRLGEGESKTFHLDLGHHNLLMFTIDAKDTLQKSFDIEAGTEREYNANLRGVTAAKKGKLTLVSDIDCLLFVDSDEGIKLIQGQAETVELDPGNHNLLAMTMDGKDTLRRTVATKARVEVQLELGLRILIAAREAKEQRLLAEQALHESEAREQQRQEEAKQRDDEAKERQRRQQQEQRDAAERERQRVENEARVEEERQKAIRHWLLFAGESFPVGETMQPFANGFTGGLEWNGGGTISRATLGAALSLNGADFGQGADAGPLTTVWMMLGYRVLGTLSSSTRIRFDIQIGGVYLNFPEYTTTVPVFVPPTFTSTTVKVGGNEDFGGAYGVGTGISISQFDMALRYLSSGDQFGPTSLILVTVGVNL